jgi:hypothetical protein
VPWGVIEVLKRGGVPLVAPPHLDGFVRGWSGAQPVLRHAELLEDGYTSAEAVISPVEKNEDTVVQWQADERLGWGESPSSYSLTRWWAHNGGGRRSPFIPMLMAIG